jgi:hypothetical protein
MPLENWPGQDVWAGLFSLLFLSFSLPALRLNVRYHYKQKQISIYALVYLSMEYNDNRCEVEVVRSLFKW